MVKANNGVCCIDEINFMTKQHRGSIHEVMEQQKITMAKAGMQVEIPTKVSIVAGMNKKNACLPVESGNISIEGSLLSRFDVVFEMEDPRDPVADLEVSMHILNESKQAQPSRSLERLKEHVMVAKEIDAKMTVKAEQVLRRYYLFCAQQPAIEKSRNTIRSWNAINRMTICHAKLLMRSEVKIIDALAVVMLMETTWSMGHLGLKQPNAMRAIYPLGPSKQMVIEILQKLNIEELYDDFMVEETPRTRNSQPSQSKHELTVHNIDSIFEDSDNDEGPLWASQSQSSQKFSKSEAELFTQPPATQQSQASYFVEDEFDEKNWNFGSTQSTSTQLTSSTQQPENESQTQPRKSSFLSLFSQPKRMKLAPTVQEKPKDTQDSAYSGLNALAANLLKQSSPQSSRPPASSSVVARDSAPSAKSADKSSGKSTAAAKLQKFQFTENSEPATSTEQEEVLESPQSSDNEEDQLDSLEDFKIFD